MSEAGEHELGPQENELATRLEAERPVPAARFRGALGRRLAERDPGYGPRPERLLVLVALYTLAGLLLLLAGVLIALS